MSNRLAQLVRDAFAINNEMRRRSIPTQQKLFSSDPNKWAVDFATISIGCGENTGKHDMLSQMIDGCDHAVVTLDPEYARRMRNYLIGNNCQVFSIHDLKKVVDQRPAHFTTIWIDDATWLDHKNLNMVRSLFIRDIHQTFVELM